MTGAAVQGGRGPWGRRGRPRSSWGSPWLRRSPQWHRGRRRPVPTPAASAVTVVARGLDGPYGLQSTGKHPLVVTEADAGGVTAVDTATGAQRTLLKRFAGPAGVDVRHGRLYVALGESQPDMPPTAPRPAFRGATVVTAGADGSRPRVLADLLAYERRADPDRQVQLVRQAGGRPVQPVQPEHQRLRDARNGRRRQRRPAGRPDDRAHQHVVRPPTVLTGECAKRPDNGGGARSAATPCRPGSRSPAAASTSRRSAARRRALHTSTG